MVYFFFDFFFLIPQPAEYGAEEFFSRRCPDAGVGKDWFRRIGGEESLAKRSFTGPGSILSYVQMLWQFGTADGRTGGRA